MRHLSGSIHHWLRVMSIALVACLALAGCASTGAAATGTQPPQPPITEVATIAPTETPTMAATSSTSSTPAPTLALDQPTQIEPYSGWGNNRLHNRLGQRVSIWPLLGGPWKCCQASLLARRRCENDCLRARCGARVVTQWE
jgi:hypothetical protein